MRAATILIAVLALASACAKPVYHTAGTVGPLQWQAIDIEQTRRSIDGRETDAHDFTLVLRETRGDGLTFDHVGFKVYKHGYEPAGGDSTNRLELPAYCELHLAFTVAGITSGLWTITLTGKDERGEPVRLTIELAVSPESSRVELPAEGASTRLPLPPTPSIRTSESSISQRLLAGLPIEERLRLQVETASVNLTDLPRLFASGEGRIMVPLGAIVSIDPQVPSELRRGLRNVAASLIPGALESNSTTTLALDLSGYGGSPGAYRFTHRVRDPQPGRCARDVLIEPVSRAADAAHGAPSLDEVASRFARHDFRIGPGWSEVERHALAAALGRIPDPLLAQVEGLTFNRSRVHSTEPENAGEYVLEAHAITIFDNAFSPSMTRFGSHSESAAGRAVWAIAHEVGHTLDLIPLRKIAEDYRRVVVEFDRTFGRYETPPGSGQYQIPPDQQSTWDERLRQVTEMHKAMEVARSASGSRWQLGPDSRQFEVVEGETTGGSVSEFRQHAAMDGPVRITKYADKDWSEYFAECFSLYIVDAQSLEWLRPNIHRYFATHFPR